MIFASIQITIGGFQIIGGIINVITKKNKVDIEDGRTDVDGSDMDNTSSGSDLENELSYSLQYVMFCWEIR
jgi:outer membrane receptor for ferrienterochelin and colicin